MKHLVTCGLSAALVCMSGLSAQAANMLADPSFEDPGLYTFDGPPFVGSWEGFSGSANASSAHDTTMPRTGTGHSTVAILGDDNSFAGVFGAIPVSAGQSVDASIWHKTPDTALLGVASEFRIEFHDAGGELSRATNDGVVPTNEYTQLSVLGAIAPAGAIEARLVYAIQTFGGEPDGGASSSGTVFLDDAFAMAIPEPTTALLAVFGLAPLALRRR